ncbi:MAG: beta-galactosidase [Chloroflexota bacterium]|nr:beta-galactosidase [Chloroflexota bacterium]
MMLSVPQSDADPFMAFAVTDPPFTSLTYGIQAFLWWDHGFAGRDLDWVRLMVFSHVKQTFAWEDIEPVDDQFNFTRADALLDEFERRDLRVVARLSDAPPWAFSSANRSASADIHDTPPDNLADYADFCGALAERYRGRIAAYQIWNEPNLGREWGGATPDAAGYVGLLAACSSAIRRVDPDAILISAGLAPTGTWDATTTPDDVYLQALYDADFTRHIDVVGLNAPGYNQPPHVSPDEAQQMGGQRFFTFRRVEDMRQIMIRNGDAARQVAILELGWTTDQIHPDYSWFAVDDLTQARYLVEAYRYAAEHWQPWVGLMSMIYIADPDWTANDEELWWSITRPNGATTQSYFDLANMAKFCGDRVIPARAPDSAEAMGFVPVDPCD